VRARFGDRAPVLVETTLLRRGAAEKLGELDTSGWLFTDEALLLRARNCDVHQGDWAVVLPVVAAFLAAIPAAADTLSIAQAARSDPRFDSLSVDDRRLALALLSYSDSLRIYTTVHGHREAIGQHRICAARTAGVTHLPVWYDSRSPRPPAAATPLQRR